MHRNSRYTCVRVDRRGIVGKKKKKQIDQMLTSHMIYIFDFCFDFHSIEIVISISTI